MQTFILRRLLSGVVILFILSIGVFFLMRVVPGDPVIRICQLNCTPQQIDQIHKDLGLDKPYFPIDWESEAPFVSFHGNSQYWSYTSGVLTGDLGTSNFNHKPVWPQVKARLPVTLLGQHTTRAADQSSYSAVAALFTRPRLTATHGRGMA